MVSGEAGIDHERRWWQMRMGMGMGMGMGMEMEMKPEKSNNSYQGLERRT
jgi:hypothetical protein